MSANRDGEEVEREQVGRRDDICVTVRVGLFADQSYFKDVFWSVAGVVDLLERCSQVFVVTRFRSDAHLAFVDNLLYILGHVW